MNPIERTILPTYLRHLARLAETAPVIKAADGDNLAVVAVPIDPSALREAATEFGHLRAALQNIAIGGNGDRVWSATEMRAIAFDAIGPGWPGAAQPLSRPGGRAR